MRCIFYSLVLLIGLTDPGGSFAAQKQAQVESICTEGMGELAGFCGIYAGLLAEEQDPRNRCNLLFADAVKLELAADSTVILHLGEVNELISTPGHVIGRLPVNPQKRTVYLISRICSPLSGFNSSSGTCKILHLTGGFSRERDRVHFAGSYTIREERTNNSCRYGLSMDRKLGNNARPDWQSR